MTELIEAAVSWSTLLVAILVFSLLPDVALRLLLLAYPRTHPRRRELIAELKIVPRQERPFWVAEQVCMILCEGLPTRLRVVRATVLRRRHRPDNAAVISSLKGRELELAGLTTLGIDVARLTETQRYVVLSRIVDGHTAEEVAGALGSTAGAVRVAQHRRPAVAGARRCAVSAPPRTPRPAAHQSKPEHQRHPVAQPAHRGGVGGVDHAAQGVHRARRGLPGTPAAGRALPTAPAQVVPHGIGAAGSSPPQTTAARPGRTTPHPKTDRHGRAQPAGISNS